MKKISLLRLPIICFLTVLYQPFLASRCAAQAGNLDPTLGFGGVVTKTISTETSDATAIAVQPDGKIIIAGISKVGTDYSFAIIRYKPNGVQDSTFGTYGMVLTPISAGLSLSEYVGSVIVQPDGKILVTGSSHGNFLLLRYLPDGTPDPGFGTGGKVASLHSGLYGRSVLQPDGKIVICGTTNDDFAVVRYMADGTLDGSFSGSGAEHYGSAGIDDCRAIALQPDGKIVLGGSSELPSTTGNFTLWRLKADGTLDATFGSAGTVVIPLENMASYGMALALQPDGKIILSGYSLQHITADKFNFAMTRVFANGKPDSAFGTAGSVVMPLTSEDDFSSALALQADGKILQAGMTSGLHSSDFGMVRYNNNGTPDLSFNTTGKVLCNLNMTTGTHFANCIALQADNKILLGGTTSATAEPYIESQFALARFLPGVVTGIVPEAVTGNAIRIYPNPVADNAVIEYSLADAGIVNIFITDMQGRKVATVLDNAQREAGMNTFRFRIPQQLPKGDYSVIIATANGSASARILR